MKHIFPVILALLILSLTGCGSKAEGNRTFTQIDQETAKQMMAADDGHVVVDVRRQDEYDSGHIPGAILIPNESIGPEAPSALPDYDQTILVYCRSGNRSKQASRKLAGMGYTHVYEFGGIIDWTGEVVTTEEEQAEKKAVISFSSFSGGGYEYTVKVDDPSIVRCESRYEYEPHADEIDGASFDFIVTVTGLKPGETNITVYGRSPIAENENHVYTASVDEDFSVVLTPVRNLSSLYAHRFGEIMFDSYSITMNEAGYSLTTNEETEQTIGTETVNALMKVIDTYDVISWDGFNESDPNVLDGEGFWLDFAFTDGTRVQARGNNAFPEHYFEAMGTIWSILTDVSQEKPGMLPEE